MKWGPTLGLEEVAPLGLLLIVNGDDDDDDLLYAYASLS